MLKIYKCEYFLCAQKIKLDLYGVRVSKKSKYCSSLLEESVFDNNHDNVIITFTNAFVCLIINIWCYLCLVIRTLN